MRFTLSLVLLAFACCFPSLLLAQADKPFAPPEIRKIYVGFQAYDNNEPSSFKVGLWAPVHVEVFGGTEGIGPKPDKTPPYLVLETEDSEDVGTRIRVPVIVEPLKSRTFTGYIKTGHTGANDIRILLNIHGREYTPRTVDMYRSVNINEHLYVTLGPRIDLFHEAIRKSGRDVNKKEEFGGGKFNPRHVAYESDAKRLPDVWFGYNGVDLLVLSTENRDFLNTLRNDHEKLKALAQWVRRGGRLVLPIARQEQAAVSALLQAEIAWQPPLPVVPPPSAGNPQEYTIKRFAKVEGWANVQGEPFHIIDPKNPQLLIPIPIARLDPDKVAPGDWEVLADSDDGRPLIAQVRYGLGQITYLAFSLDDPHFRDWTGKEQFLKTMVIKLAPRVPEMQNAEVFGRGSGPNDLSTELLIQLDNFDVTVIPFGYVALFIILYILVVGPLDFFLLKYVFKRMEWTWITFPTVVLGVSVIAYFAAYALKGQDLKINKVDIVDFDLRTDLNAKREPRSVHAYGQSFFTILSPRIQNYTLGVEPNPLFWGDKVDQVALGMEKVDKVLSADLMSWMGRPSGGFNDMNRSGSSGFFRKPYTYRDDASALEGVPIPVWTTKAFTAAWEQKLPNMPFKVDLTYHQKEIQGKEIKISGTLENHLGVDLFDVWLIYGNRCYPIADGLKSVKGGAVPALLAISAHTSKDMQAWIREAQEEAPEARAWSSNPGTLVKQILFHESVEQNNVMRNHLLRPLDLSWRLDEERRDLTDTRTREAILFGRVRFASGGAEALTSGQPLPAKLWLGDMPETGKRRPALVGHLNQDTFVRAILPLRPDRK